ncbi:uncharacterized protein LACBIDRAFT_330881 [Laccaria bicolor S238N-H82]|uniref:Predicted protein n=1 Tax=Laccaria bicolor (strain S238N-H82 / ATCC MYA-4686) TaxID=486041 RepID=B0DN21_LACBS|nr:uncharacterized protein LACBIDRAFT_330881 [Laccaria bicolor S238N-H82]EDR03976.1 predicted protein [Laccaria bicolor S238N-H82]|eukprot:XP_001885231.1 predicted protein [Laccaria bicolor S238N-H82]
MTQRFMLVLESATTEEVCKRPELVNFRWQCGACGDFGHGGRQSGGGIGCQRETQSGYWHGVGILLVVALLTQEGTSDVLETDISFAEYRDFKRYFASGKRNLTIQVELIERAKVKDKAGINHDRAPTVRGILHGVQRWKFMGFIWNGSWERGGQERPRETSQES